MYSPQEVMVLSHRYCRILPNDAYMHVEEACGLSGGESENHNLRTWEEGIGPSRDIVLSNVHSEDGCVWTTVSGSWCAQARYILAQSPLDFISLGQPMLG